MTGATLPPSHGLDALSSFELDNGTLFTWKSNQACAQRSHAACACASILSCVWLRHCHPTARLLLLLESSCIACRWSKSITWGLGVLQLGTSSPEEARSVLFNRVWHCRAARLGGSGGCSAMFYFEVATCWPRLLRGILCCAVPWVHLVNGAASIFFPQAQSPGHVKW